MRSLAASIIRSSDLIRSDFDPVDVRQATPLGRIWLSRHVMLSDFQFPVRFVVAWSKSIRSANVYGHSQKYASSLGPVKAAVYHCTSA